MNFWPQNQIFEIEARVTIRDFMVFSLFDFVQSMSRSVKRPAQRSIQRSKDIAAQRSTQRSEFQKYWRSIQRSALSAQRSIQRSEEQGFFFEF